MQVKKMNESEKSDLGELIIEIFSPIIERTVEITLARQNTTEKQVEEEIGITEAAELLHCTEGHLYNLTSQRAISFFKEGKYTRFYRSEILAWKNARKKSKEQISNLKK